MRAITKTTALFATYVLCASGALAQSARPNILLVIGDDIGMDVSTEMYPDLINDLLEQYGPDGHGHPDYRRIDEHPASLPRLSELANQGMRFTNVWAHPFCSPTRAAIITGLFAAETKIANYQEALSQTHSTFVQRLKDDGYSTALFGKWHLAGLGGGGGGARAGGARAGGARAGGARAGGARGAGAARGAAAAPAAGAGANTVRTDYTGMTPKEAGFDLFRGNMGAALGTFWDHQYQVQQADTPARAIVTEPTPERSLPGIASTTYAPVVKIADTIDWIRTREAEDPDKPWFSWLAFNLSHATSQRVPAQMAVPNADTLNEASLKEMQACGGVFGSQDTGDCSGEAVMRAMTSSLDTLLGMLIDEVENLDPNTYIIYVGDNGTPMYGRPGLDFIENMYITRTARGKGTVYESGARVPMVIKGPGIEPGSSNAAVSHVVDLYATILSLAGLDAPATVPNADASGMIPLEGRSLAPVLFDGAAAVRGANDVILTETHDLMRDGIREVGARDGRYKVLCTDGTAMGQCSFYDLADDPLEEYPLAIPDSCSDSARPTDPAWHYCNLTSVVATKSFMR